MSGIKESLSLLTCIHHTDGPEGFKAIPLSDPHFCQSIVAPFFLHFFLIFYSEHYNLTEPHSSSCPLIDEIVYIKMTSGAFMSYY